MKQILKVQLKSSEIVLMSLIILVFGFLLHFFWKSSDAAKALVNTRTKVEVSKRSLAENKALYEKLVSRAPAANGVANDYLDQYVLLNDHFSSVITGIVNSSRTKGFSLSKVALEDQSTESGYKKILYSLDVEASFIDIGKFLEKLEDSPLLTEVRSVEINRIGNEMKRCQAHIKLYSYVRIE